MQEETALVTEDRWLREAGWLDPTDRQIINEASANGFYKLRIITIKEMIEAMAKEDPLKFRGYKREMEKQAGKTLTYEELVDFSAKANERMKEFTDVVKNMNLGQASQIRVWRCDTHMTWRSIARATWREKWFGRRWGPPENQIMGMSLVEKAAQLFGENYREAPWN